MLFFMGTRQSVHELWEVLSCRSIWSQNCWKGTITRQDFWLPTGIKLIADLKIPYTEAMELLKGLNFSISTYRATKVIHLAIPFSASSKLLDSSKLPLRWVTKTFTPSTLGQDYKLGLRVPQMCSYKVSVVFDSQCAASPAKRCFAAHTPLRPCQHQSFIHTRLQRKDEQRGINKTAPFGIAMPGMWVKLWSRFSSADVGVLSKRWQIWWAGLQLRLSLQSLSIQTWSGPERENVSIILTYMLSQSEDASVVK